MTRPPFAILAMAASALFSGCGGDGFEGRIYIDLNRTTSKPLFFTPLAAADTVPFTITPDANGVYTLATDTVAEGLYVARWDADHALPVVVRQRLSQRLCGTFQFLDSLTASDPESAAVIAAERLRRRLRAATDSALTAAPLTTPEGKRLVADSLTHVRRLARSEADALLNTLPDSSVAALPILGLNGLYDDVTDNEILSRRLNCMAARFPSSSHLSSRREALALAARLAKVRSRLSAGNPAPDFTFLTLSGDTISDATLANRRYAIALLPDSASAARPLEFVALLASDGHRVLVEAHEGVQLPRKGSVIRGRFLSLTHKTDLRAFAPSVIAVSPTAGIVSMRLGAKSRQQD